MRRLPPYLRLYRRLSSLSPSASEFFRSLSSHETLTLSLCASEFNEVCGEVRKSVRLAEQMIDLVPGYLKMKPGAEKSECLVRAAKASDMAAVTAIYAHFVETTT